MEVAAAGWGSCGMSVRVEMKPRGCHPRSDRHPLPGCPSPPLPTGLARGFRAEATMSLCLSAGAGEANPPQTHPKSPCSITNAPSAPSAAPVGGSHRGPRGSAPNSIQPRLNAPSIPRRLPHPKAPTRLPRPPARSVAPSGVLSTPFAPRASPGPSPDPAPSHRGSPVLRSAVGSQVQDSRARAGTGGEGGQPSTGTRGASGATLLLHLRPGGDGRERGKAAAVSRARGGKGVTPRAGPPRDGGCGHPRGGWQDVGCTPKRGSLGGLGPTGGPAEQLRAGARVAPKGEVTANLVPGLPPPRARCGHGQGGGQGALRCLNTGKRFSTRGAGG